MGVISPRSLRLLVGKRIFFSAKLFQLFPVAAIKRQHCAPRYEDLFSALTDLFNFYPNPRIRIKVENFGSCPGLPYQCFALFNPLKGFVISGGTPHVYSTITYRPCISSGKYSSDGSLFMVIRLQ